MDRRVTRYVGGGMQRVAGYLAPLDAWACVAVLRAQARDGIGGALAEIGVAYGRSFLLLALMRAPGEALVGCDLFKGGVAGEQYRALMASARHLGVEIEAAALHHGPSEALDGESLRARYGAARFVHIDAGHGREAVRGDALTAARFLQPGGAIVFDDFCEARWPDVTFGICDFLAERPDFAICAMTRTKALVARADHAEFYAAALRGAGELAFARRVESAVAGREVPLFEEPPAAAVRRRLMEAAGARSGRRRAV